MAVPLPPWLQFSPETFASAAEAGQNLALKRSQMQQDAILSMAQINASREASMRDHDIALQKLAIDHAQQDIEARDAATKFAAQKTYSQLISQGVDPVDAALQVGPGLLGESVGGLGTLKRAQSIDKFQPTTVTTPEGDRLFEASPGRWEKATVPKEFQDATREVDGQKIYGQEDSTGRFVPYASSQLTTDKDRENQVLRLQAQRQKIISDSPYGMLLDSGDDISKFPAAQALKKQLDEIDKHIQQIQSGGKSDGGVKVLSIEQVQ